VTKIVKSGDGGHFEVTLQKTSYIYFIFIAFSDRAQLNW